MTVKELRETLNKFPDGIEVMIEIPINGVEFNNYIEKVYESGKLYIHGAGLVLSDGDVKRLFGVDTIESED